MRQAILAIDQGTTNTKALLYAAHSGELLARVSRPVGIVHPKPDWAEQSADAIWASVTGAISDVIAAGPCEILAVALANQRETVVLWDAATGQPVAPAIGWQCRRTSKQCASLKAHERLIVERTGLAIDPLFPSTKLTWLLDNIPGARARAAAGELRAGTIDSWLLWKLTEGRVHATDVSNASRTQLLSLDTLDWDRDMLKLFGIPCALLPNVMPSDSNFGTVSLAGLPPGIPVHAMLGDSHAALLGHCFDQPGTAKVTCGTGSSLMAVTPARVQSSSGLSSTVAWSKAGETVYALEGNVAVSGHAAAFGTELLGLADEQELSALAQSVPDSGRVVFVPALAGLGAPHWQDNARGLLSGLSLGTTRAHIARAIIEGMALQISDVVLAMDADLGTQLSSISVDGGAASNDFFVQTLADVIARPVMRPDELDLSARGVARLAAETVVPGAAAWKPVNRTEFAPRMEAAERTALLEQWHASVSAAARLSTAFTP